jgi:hypothetical protein
MFSIRNKNVKFDRYGLYSDHNQLGDNKRSLGATVRRRDGSLLSLVQYA